MLNFRKSSVKYKRLIELTKLTEKFCSMMSVLKKKGFPWTLISVLTVRHDNLVLRG